jgi:prevent-host-death family protein
VDVGIRELRADLSRYLRRVRDGDEVVVTDRGTPVARLVPFERESESRFDQMVREGLIIPAPHPWRGPLPEPIEGAGPLSDIVLDDRR